LFFGEKRKAIEGRKSGGKKEFLAFRRRVAHEWGGKKKG